MKAASRTRRGWGFVLAIALVALAAGKAQAHQPSDSYLTLKMQENSVQGRWDIALRDLDFLLALDVDDDGRLTWGEVRSRLPEIESYAMQHVALAADGAACPLDVKDRLVDTHADGAYLVLDVVGACPRPPRAVQLRYDFLLGVDAMHRGLLRLAIDQASHSAVLVPGAALQTFQAGRSGGWKTLTSYLANGVHHIWVGYDHLLFLISLLLPSVALRRGGRWVPAPHWRPVAHDVLRTVTAFTVAHSVTLVLASLRIITLPGRWVESVIALTVVLAALNNVFAVIDTRRWLVALVFGLVHGFGFASVLDGLDLPGAGARAVALLGFNLGVEIGQLAVVAVLLPALYLIRGTPVYRRAILAGGSCLVAALASVWLVERAFDVRLLSLT